MAEFIAASAAVLMVPSIKGFKQKLEVALSTVDAAVKVAVDLKAGALAKPTAEIKAWKDLMEEDRVKIKVDLDTKGLTKSITEIRHQYQDLAGDVKKGLLLNLKITGMSLLPQLGTALASVNQSIVALSQSTLLLPGILAGAASAFGTLLIGVHGVRNAFTAYNTAIKDSAGDAKRTADATRQLTNANRDLNAATRDAKRSLEDLNAQMRDAPLDEATAILDLKDAQIQLADSFGKTGLQRQRDAIAVEKAEANLANTRTRNVRLFQDADEANKRGVAGNPAVLDALDRQTKAQEDLNTASKGGAAIAAALNKLSPNAQDFVTKIHSMSGALSQLRNNVQDKLFAGLGDEVVQLGTKLPVVEKGFSGIASGLNTTFKTTLANLGSDKNVGFLDRIFGNTGDASARLGNALKPLLDGFIHLAAVGSDFLPRLVNGFGALGDRFANFIDKADKDGSLDKWINTGIQALTDLGNSFVNIGSILSSVSEAFTGSGGKGFLTLLADGTKRLADFLKGAEGQEKLKQFFYNARAELEKWLPLFRDIPGLIVTVKNAAQDWADIFLPFLSTTVQILHDYPGLVTAVFTAFVAWKSLKPIVTGLHDALGAGKTAVSAFKDAIGAAATAMSGANGFTGKVQALSGLIGTGGLLMGALSVVGIALAVNYVQDQQQAAQATEHHADMVHRLTGEIDGLSGAITKSGLLDKLKALGGFTSGNLDGKFDVPQLAQDSVGLSRTQFANSLDPANQPARDFALDKTYTTLKASIQRGDYWKNNGAQLTKDGFTLDDLTKAAGGDASSVAKFNALGSKQPGGGAGTTHPNPFTLSDIVQGYNSPIPGGTGLKGLDAAGKGAAIVGGVINEESNAGLAAGNQTRTNNAAVNGTDTLKPAGMALFGKFGSPKAYPTSSGGTSIQVDRSLAELKASDPQFVKDVEANGGSITELGSGSQITLSKGRAEQYVKHIPAAATGGMFKGPGSGTSDSILARVSNGEFVTKASQVAKNPALYHGLNSGAIDPRSLARFDGGGLADTSGTFTGGTEQKPWYSFLQGKRATSEDSLNQIKTGAGGAWDWVNNHKIGLDGITPKNPAPTSLDNKGLPFDTTPFGIGTEGDQSVTGASRREHQGLAPANAPDGNGEYANLPKQGTKGWTLNPATGKWAPPGGAVPAPKTPALSPWKPAGSPGDVPGSPGPAGVPPLFSPENTNPALNNPLGVGPALPAEAGYVPPLASAVPGIGTGPSNLPDNLQPVGILEKIGSVFLDAILGFFGINPEYINTIKQGLGFLKPGKRADPNVQTILDSSGNPVPEAKGVPDASQTPFVGNPSNAASRATAMAEQMKGKMYEWGGATLNGTDCSGLVAYIADAYIGKPFSGRSGGTGGFAETLPAKGAIIVDDPSKLPPGTLQIGWNAEHTSGTLPDGRGFEANDRGIPIHLGPGAGGAKEPGFTNWAYFPAMASGGMLSGPGSGTSDSILARVSDGEFITRAAVVAKNPDLFHGLNSGAIDPRSMPKFGIGGMADAKLLPVGADGKVSTKGSKPSGWNPAKAVGAAAPGASLPGVATAERGAIGAAPAANAMHSISAVNEGIDGAATAIGNAAQIAAAAATFGAGGALGGGAGGGAGGSLIGGATQLGSGVAKGIANITASLLVGTATPGTTGAAYGSPTLPQKNQQGPQGPQIVNQYGDIHTASYDEFYKGQQRREQQQQAPHITSLGK